MHRYDSDIVTGHIGDALKACQRVEQAHADRIAEQFLMRREFLVARVNRRGNEARHHGVFGLRRAFAVGFAAVAGGVGAFILVGLVPLLGTNPPIVAQQPAWQPTQSASTLQAAIVAAEPGAIIALDSGSLQESIVVSKGVRLVAKNGSVRIGG